MVKSQNREYMTRTIKASCHTPVLNNHSFSFENANPFSLVLSIPVHCAGRWSNDGNYEPSLGQCFVVSPLSLTVAGLVCLWQGDLDIVLPSRIYSIVCHIGIYCRYFRRRLSMFQIHFLIMFLHSENLQSVQCYVLARILVQVTIYRRLRIADLIY